LRFGLCNRTSKPEIAKEVNEGSQLFKAAVGTKNRPCSLHVCKLDICRQRGPATPTNPPCWKLQLLLASRSVQSQIPTMSFGRLLLWLLFAACAVKKELQESGDIGNNCILWLPTHCWFEHLQTLHHAAKAYEACHRRCGCASTTALSIGADPAESMG